MVHIHKECDSGLQTQLQGAWCSNSQPYTIAIWEILPTTSQNYRFAFMPKIHYRTLSKYNVPWRYLVNFLPKIYQNLILTSLKGIFSIFRFLCTLFWIIIVVYISIQKNYSYDWFCGPGSQIALPDFKHQDTANCYILDMYKFTLKRQNK